ncbi:SpoIID/LytB domain-containing protein [Pseudokineococcus sp. 1T1Z-3]|uniref:SpoIID/LytB domain-containing protein n=1 Tax=Pseudokineococcus sp. 1T1Z-3 TaxID=3132745 RepID=UPI0030A7DF9A
MRDDRRGRAVEKYLRGLGEMPVSWPVEAQAAQVVAARSFLLGKWRGSEGAYVVRPTTSDQVWLGADKEEEDRRYGGKLAAAVATTSSGGSGTVMTTPGGSVARDLLYASSHGGWSESNTYVWGSTQVPHLRPVDDSRWDEASGNPYRSWTVGLSWEQVARAFGFSRVDAVSLPERGRAARTGGVTVTGVRDGRVVRASFTGQQARDRLATVDPAVRSSGFTFSVPSTTEGVAIAGDWDGDGLDEVAWWHAGVFTLRARDGGLRTVAFGPKGGVPVAGDWEGDGRDSIGVFDDGWWYLGDASSSGALERTVRYGTSGDLPAPGRWAAGSADGLGVVRGNHWLLRPSTTSGAATAVLSYGRRGDAMVPGDWDGDGRDEPGARRGNTFHRSGAGAIPFGRPGDSPLAGRWLTRTADLPGVGREGTVWALTREDGASMQRLPLHR